jgi:hypothetical protein
MAETPNHRHPEVAYSCNNPPKADNSYRGSSHIAGHWAGPKQFASLIIVNLLYIGRGSFRSLPSASSQLCFEASNLYLTQNTVSHTQSQPIMDPSQVDVPPLKDLTIDNITENVNLINSGCPDPRMKYLLERLVQHLHDYARETRLSHNEWMTAIQFLTSVGQICTDVRQVRQPKIQQTI